MPERRLARRLDDGRVRRRGAPGQGPRRSRSEPGSSATSAGEHMDTDDLAIRRWGESATDTLARRFTCGSSRARCCSGRGGPISARSRSPTSRASARRHDYVLEPKDPNVLLPELLPFLMQTDAFIEHAVGDSAGRCHPYSTGQTSPGSSSPCRRSRSSGGLRELLLGS